MSDKQHPIAEQFVIDAKVILGKQYAEFEDMVRWMSWHLEREASCSDPGWVTMSELHARHKAGDYIDLIHYIADIVQCPNPRYKNKVKAHFEERDKRHLERMEMYCRQAQERE